MVLTAEEQLLESNTCSRCRTSVTAQKTISLDQYVYHETCFTCLQCNSPVTKQNVANIEVRCLFAFGPIASSILNFGLKWTWRFESVGLLGMCLLPCWFLSVSFFLRFFSSQEELYCRRCFMNNF